MESKEFSDISKERLSKIIESKVRTTFIGDLNTFEQEFESLLKNDPNFKKVWVSVRKKILDSGNNHIRALQKELRQYTIYWTGEEHKFKVLGGSDD